MMIAGAAVMFALGAGAMSLIGGNEPAPTVQVQVPGGVNDPVVVLVPEPARPGEYCKEIRSPDWTRASGDKDTLARANLMWAYYDEARANAVNEAGACSCAAFFPPFDEAEKRMRAEIEGKDAGEINTLARDLNSKNEVAMAAAHKLCRGHKE